MQYPLPVDVDISMSTHASTAAYARAEMADKYSVLDPYLLNVFPRSLVPTALYIVTLAVGSWFLSGVIWDWLRSTRLPKARKD